MTSRYRPRRQFKFLLYQDIDMEVLLTDFIARLKGERQFVTVVKNGLRLMGSLMEKDLSVLYELFPWIEAAILANAPKTPAPPSGGDLEAQIADLKNLILQQGRIGETPVGYPVMKPSTGTLGVGKVLALPTFDDDDDGDTLVIREGVKTSSFENLMASFAKADERSDRDYAEQLAAGNIDPRTGRRIQTVQPGLD